MKRRSLALLALLAVLWGIPYLLIRVAVEELSPAVVVFARCALGAAVVLPIALATGGLRGLRARLRELVVLAAVEMALPFTFITVGEQAISSSLAGILVACAPLFVALLAARVDRAELVTGRRALGLLLGFAGVVSLLGLDVRGDARELAGAGLVLLAALGYAAGSLMLKLRFADAAPLGVMALVMAVSAALLAAPAALTAPARVPTAEVLGALAVLGTACTGGAFALFAVLNAQVGPSRASVVAYLAPGVAVLLGAVVLHEPVGASTLLGLALILVGSRLVTATAGARLLPARRRAAARGDAVG